jgi:acyl-CoA synthetase (AMP-forming)/AMP-acid ligase II
MDTAPSRGASRISSFEVHPSHNRHIRDNADTKAGGENIYPLEIEERLVEHPSITRAIVVGVSHPRYVEVPAAFLLHEEGTDKPSLDEVRAWVRKVLGRHKAPVHVFWLGEDCSDEIPLTGSGKIKKFVLRDVAEDLLKEAGRS